MRHLGAELIDLILGIGASRRCGHGIGLRLRRIRMLQTLGLEFHLFAKQLPFTPEALGCVLRQHSQVRGCIRQSAAKTGAEPIQGGLYQGLRRAHGLPQWV